MSPPQAQGDVFGIHADSPPFTVHEGGVVRIGNSRISLDLVVEQYQNGVSAEEMVRAYDTLNLAEVYATIAYYLRHREQVEAYLKRRREEAQAQQAKIEADRPSISRQELLARRAAIEQEHAPTGH